MDCTNSTLLMASDLSVFSSEIFRYAVHLASQMGCQMVVVHSVEPLGVLADAMLETYMPNDFLGQVREKGMPVILDAIRQEVLESIAHECEFHNVPVHIVKDLHVGVGDACEVILNAAKDYGVDLIVCGSGSPEHPLPTAIGRTASKLLQLSHVPVVMVPASQVADQSKALAG